MMLFEARTSLRSRPRARGRDRKRWPEPATSQSISRSTAYGRTSAAVYRLEAPKSLLPQVTAAQPVRRHGDMKVDSTVCRAHQHGAGAHKQGDLRKEPPGGIVTEPRDHGLGRSRGGFTTELHLAVEQGQKPMSIVVTAGQRGDSPQFEPVLARVRVPRIGLGRPRVRPNRVRADKAYASRKNRAYLRRRGIPCTIPDKADQARNRQANSALYTIVIARLPGTLAPVPTWNDALPRARHDAKPSDASNATWPARSTKPSSHP